MLSFEALPPEINSGLMYCGPGVGPMTAASTAWTNVADGLYSAAASYGSTIVDLTSTWLGPSSQSMAAAGATYVSWIRATAALAQQTAVQARAAAAAYEAAFASTVPPAAIAANRALLLALVATNFFGQNTPAIMATEAEYVEMWAQDAAAMYGYAAASSAASTMTPFTTPPETTTSAATNGLTVALTQAGQTSAGTASQTVSSLSSAAMPNTLQAVSSSVSSSSTTLSTSTSSGAALSAGSNLVSGTTSSASMLTSAASMLGSAGTLSKSLGPVSGGFPMFKSALDIGASPAAGAWNGSSVSAAAGRAASLGTLSVPAGWTSAAPAFSQVATALPAGSGAPLATSAAMPGSQAGPIGAPLAQTAESGAARSPLAARYNFRPPMVQRPVYAG